MALTEEQQAQVEQSIAQTAPQMDVQWATLRMQCLQMAHQIAVENRRLVAVGDLQDLAAADIVTNAGTLMTYIETK